MAIKDIAEYSHLSEADIESLGRELDTIRRDIEDSLGSRDARYILRTIAAQRILDAAGRYMIFASRGKAGWLAGTAALAVAKIIENMEISHNVLHGQWDWMNDPEIHSTTWEWDMPGPSVQWKYAHNVVHHKYTNIVGMDEDVGFGIIRVTRDQEWKPIHLLQPLQNLLLAAGFEWGIALHDLQFDGRKPSPEDIATFRRKIVRQVGKDYVFFPALSGRRWKQTLAANGTANLARNIWAHLVISCGHFPDGAEKFVLSDLENETQAEWYLRQMLGSANFEAGPAMAFMSGNLCYQIEHHLFPDLPSNRAAEIAERVRQLCEKYDLPYTTGSLMKQAMLTQRTVFKLALPDRMLRATSDDAPETASELRFKALQALEWVATDPATGRRRGLSTALAELKVQRKRMMTELKAQRKRIKRERRQRKAGSPVTA
ncbi:fatty acid desaturase family protein [Hoyosella altamirensis]|uniref:Fatty acid desaturase n=1 Tax=Hoyosella altamirensis TaxID=616997 RepID=A0A839RHK6_9ACTN|nr:acyl-CoA desaturase [Hoyosella altamirensis]MBB3036242.1 fatty acid desaturase [Hoyosella altamirensis]